MMRDRYFKRDGGKNRVGPGRPDGGEYTAMARAESPLEGLARSTRDALAAAASATSGEELWPAVNHEDLLVRAEAAMNPNLTDAQLQQLLSDPEWVVRWELAREQLRPGVAAALAHDPSPIVRAAAAEGWDLPDAERERLHADPEVAQVVSIVTAA